MAQFNLSQQIYLPNWDVWARPITVTPLVSQPGAPAYGARGYFDTKEMDVLAEDGSIISDSKVILDIRIEEFSVVPLQRDQIYIPPHQGEQGGTFEVLDLSGDGNAGGIITLTLKKIVAAKPTP